MDDRPENRAAPAAPQAGSPRRHAFVHSAAAGFRSRVAPMNAPLDPLVLRDPQAMLAETRRGLNGTGDLWVFGYASLIWRPEFESVERRMAVVHGLHRALEMRSRVNRGTPECPGLVFALVARRLVPRRRLPHRARTCRARARAALAARDADRRLRPAAGCAAAARRRRAARRERARLHARPAQPQPHRAARRRADARHPAHSPAAATAARSTTCSTPRSACASAASATARSSAWCARRARTRCG